jgi:hypothetical protein
LSEHENITVPLYDNSIIGGGILWRRSKLGLRFDEPAFRHLADWLADHSNVEPVKAI